MQLRPDDILQEYMFSEQEELLVKTLTPLQIAWLQTKYARIFKEKASTLVPEEAGLDRSYLLKLGELDGKLSLIQELFEDHKNAISKSKTLKNTENASAGTIENEKLATRAAQLVN
jgi:hypothetical protein